MCMHVLINGIDVTKGSSVNNNKQLIKVKA